MTVRFPRNKAIVERSGNFRFGGGFDAFAEPAPSDRYLRTPAVPGWWLRMIAALTSQHSARTLINARSGRNATDRPARRTRLLHQTAVDGGMRQMRQDRPFREQAPNNTSVRPDCLQDLMTSRRWAAFQAAKCRSRFESAWVVGLRRHLTDQFKTTTVQGAN